MKRATPKGGATRTEFERERDLAEIAELRFQGLRQWEIADHLTKARPYIVTQSMVSDDCLELQKRWRESALMDTHEEKMRMLDELDELKRFAYQKFELSERARQSKTTETIPNEEPQKGGGKAKRISIGRLKMTVKVEDQTGDTAYLRVVQYCIDKRASLLGLEAPKKFAPTNPDGNEPYLPGAELDVTERARRVASILTCAQKRKEGKQDSLPNP